MKQKIDLEVHWELHTRFNKLGLYYSSFVHLSNLYHYYKYYDKKLPDNILSSFCMPISEEMINDIHKSINVDYKKTQRIISIGQFWLDDEWLLMFSLRFDIEFIKDFLLDKGLPFPDLDLHGLCEEMKAASLVGKKNKQQFQSAVNAITKNSSLPFLDIWFEADQHPRQSIPNDEEVK
ncbi:hypothetical protein [Candidatus Bodocaedibacter vickermanii]|uniref:Uncharacterized protein n=1 Tax=Candidatus Bodocaedibacter vickermanii TaxID=2741701 RepID=A0A7L9RUY6_9PROT|nr:hypothetical protein CPBP_00969 [Candidatus Paracaedibacteraceae bacterium 'Lake Konstanz']